MSSGGLVNEFGYSCVNATTLDDLKFAIDLVMESRKLLQTKTVVGPTADSTSDDIGDLHPKGAFMAEG